MGAEMNEREALKLALEALESCDAAHITDGGHQWYDEKLVDKAVEALETAQLEQEHAAEIARLHEIIKDLKYDIEFLEQKSPQRKPLSDEEIYKASTEAKMQEHYMGFHSGFIRFARAIEAAHGIKGEV